MTVSYGTFSCTLEGFDDSFGTMKAIAEYFRNLAAEDRYFGAEPPTPDAEMLQRIVEKEIHRRVEARVSEQGITLKAAEDDGAAPVVQPETVTPIAEAPPAEMVAESFVEPAEQEVSAVTEPQEVSVAEEPAADIPATTAEQETPFVTATEAPVETAETEAEPGPLPEPVFAEPVEAAPFVPASAPAESLAEKLARIRAVVARSRQVEEIKPQEPPAEVSLPEPCEETIAEAPEQTAVAADESMPLTLTEPIAELPMAELPIDGPDFAEPPAAELPIVEAANEEQPSAMVEEFVEIETAPEEFTTDTAFAEFLEEAPVDEIAVETADSPVLDEPEVAEDSLEAEEVSAYEEEMPRSNVIRVRKQSLMASLRAALSEKEDETAVDDTALNDDISVPDLVETAEATVEMPMPEQPVSLDTEETFEPETIEAEDVAEAYATEPEQLSEPSASGLSPDEEADLLRELEAVEREMAADSAEIAALETESQAEALRALDGQDTPASTELESLEQELSALAFASHSAFAEPVTGVDTHDDAEVITQETEEETFEEAEKPVETVAFRAVEDTTAPVGDEDDDQLAEAVARVAQSSEEETRAEAAAERRARALGQEHDENHNVSRLMDEADNKLAGPELRRRRSAIEHLKAAVAATKAEGPRNRDDDGDTLPYRDDLRAAVATSLQSQKPDADATLPPKAELEAQEAADKLDFTAIKPEHENEQPVSEDAAPKPAEPVRPRRPARSELRDREITRPVTTSERLKVAPLMLVSEQRVDDDAEAKPREPASVQPVRPRRVTAGRMVSAAAEKAPSENELEESSRSSMVSSDREAAGIFAESTTFEEFSERMGARGLEEMLECAAAYTSYVQGRTHFSHPEIMDVVRQAEGQEDLRREDSLRSFGQLLRQGKIQKLDRGQFTLSQASRYNPEQRSVAL
ncbi:hypothetical protein [Aliiruegeria lutimaris]|uniref:hypothetical protein n=1 Tax=Aliiruegeria lutimaris TaxID=571298 RepID=UPI00111370D9|nr:hypothetical protein [Aliiruegeria lutimaris]